MKKFFTFALPVMLVAALFGFSAQSGEAAPGEPSVGAPCPYHCPYFDGQATPPPPAQRGRDAAPAAPLTQEQRDKAAKVFKEFGPKLRDVEKQIFINEQELRALQNASEPDARAVRRVAAKLTELDDEMQDLHMKMDAKLGKIAGGPWPGGFGGMRYHRMAPDFNR